jgi:hypothetical protein
MWQLMQSDQETEKERKIMASIASQSKIKTPEQYRMLLWFIRLATWRGFLINALKLSAGIFLVGFLPGITQLFELPINEALERTAFGVGIAVLAGFGAPIVMLLIAMLFYYASGKKSPPSEF